MTDNGNTEACRECGDVTDDFDDEVFMCGRCVDEYYGPGGVFYDGDDDDDGES